MKKLLLSLSFISALALSLTSCGCCDRDPCCDSTPPRPRCCDQRPCCPKPPVCCPQECEARYMDDTPCY